MWTQTLSALLWLLVWANWVTIDREAVWSLLSDLRVIPCGSPSCIICPTETSSAWVITCLSDLSYKPGCVWESHFATFLRKLFLSVAADFLSVPVMLCVQHNFTSLFTLTFLLEKYDLTCKQKSSLVCGANILISNLLTHIAPPTDL